MSTHSTLITPSSEVNSLILHAHHSCPYGKCSYCPNFGPGKREKFRIDEFREFLEEERRRYVPEEINSVFLAENNLLGMPAKHIVQIMRALNVAFPNVHSIAAYGSPRAIAGMSDTDLVKLRKEGLTRIHIGFESGNNGVLELLNKGVDSASLSTACRRVIDSGYELYVYVLIGSGGKSFSDEHIRDTAALINEVRPSTVECHTLVLIPGTPMHEMAESGAFSPLMPVETIAEIRGLVEGIQAPVGISAAHVSNYCHIEGRLPGDRERLITELDYAMTFDEERFEKTGIVNISLPN